VTAGRDTTATDNCGTNAETVAAIKAPVCAVGYLTGTSQLRAATAAEQTAYGLPASVMLADSRARAFKILGTGFLVRPQTVITNQHILRDIATLRRSGVASTRFRVVFHQAATKGPTRGVLALRPKWTYSAWIREVDIGFIHFSATPGEFVANLRPVEFPAHFVARVGDEVMVPGYALGSELVEEEDDAGETREYRIGPVVQRGVISAIARVGQSGSVYRLLLDVQTARGMSGAPVFNACGDAVVGIHYSGVGKAAEFAIPLDVAAIRTLLAVWDAKWTAILARIGGPQ
jgi:trypsin-like peptidase